LRLKPGTSPASRVESSFSSTSASASTCSASTCSPLMCCAAPHPDAPSAHAMPHRSHRSPACLAPHCLRLREHTLTSPAACGEPHSLRCLTHVLTLYAHLPLPCSNRYTLGTASACQLPRPHSVRDDCVLWCGAQTRGRTARTHADWCASLVSTPRNPRTRVWAVDLPMGCRASRRNSPIDAPTRTNRALVRQPLPTRLVSYGSTPSSPPFSPPGSPSHVHTVRSCMSGSRRSCGAGVARARWVREIPPSQRGGAGED
jgi:hypothetical protein